ncbi:MAG: DUF1467 family protein [Rhizobiales bacterium]|nr:DUF1467 family protein [Hyphomicrobiales bacterium]
MNFTITLPWPTLIALYFIVWWITLYATLPIGVKNAHEAGQEVEKGNDAGAPVSPNLGFKAILTSVLAIPLTLVMAMVITNID